MCTFEVYYVIKLIMNNRDTNIIKTCILIFIVSQFRKMYIIPYRKVHIFRTKLCLALFFFMYNVLVM